ncbi:MAG: DUF3846 domain-containing protein [Sulfuritalea sp.]|nr:DUF3846 domain-containing protein [Sulfuritalea sp.]
MSQPEPSLAIVIPPSGDSTIVELPTGDSLRLETLQAIVGGYLQVVSLPGSRYMVMNENAKAISHFANRTATAIARTAESIHDDDYIAGVAAIIPRNALR